MRELLSSNRPMYVQELVDAQYNRVSSYPLTQGYKYLGDQRVYRWYQTGTDTRELLKENGQSVLDVGAGEGRIAQSYARRGYGNKAVAFTAHDYSNGDNPTIHVGDAHHLADELPEPKQMFDIVMSQWTLRHLADPMACFEQMLNVTAENGIVVTDMPVGRTALIAGCLNWLVESGYYLPQGEHMEDALDMMREGLRVPTEVSLRRVADENTEIRLPLSYAPSVIGDTVAMYALDEGV